MPLSTQILAVVCAVTIAIGQMLFKTAAARIEEHGTVLHIQVATTMFIALSIYGAATLLWVHVLRSAPISLIYPYMALSFVIVPAFSHFIFREPINLSYVVGLVLILAGILIITRSA